MYIYIFLKAFASRQLQCSSTGNNVSQIQNYENMSFMNLTCYYMRESKHTKSNKSESILRI